MPTTTSQFLLEHELLAPEKIAKFEEEARRAGQPVDVLLGACAEIDTTALRRAWVRSFRKKALYEVLIEQKKISFQDIQRIAEKFGGLPPNLGPYLIEQHLISEDDYARALAAELGLEFVDLTTYNVDDELFNSVDVALMRDYVFIPDSRSDKEITLIMADPGNVDAIEALEVKLGLPIVPKVAAARPLQKLIAFMVETSLDSHVVFQDLDAVPSLQVVTEEEPDETPTRGVSLPAELQSEAPAIKLVDSIILKAVRKRASDIHFEVYEAQMKVKYRIDGVLFEVLGNVEPRMRAAIVSRIKVMAALDIAEKRIPQDGRFKLRIDDRFVDFRVSILPSIFGETAVLRILDKSAVGLDLQRVGLDGRDLEVFHRNINKPYGLILVAGPTGSGKTTTLYSAIKAIHTPEDKFITIEDPVEYQLPDIVQVAVNEKKGLSFSIGLRSIVRQDPDKIMVGEIRDPETAKIAVNAALTGHLVLSTIHANNVMDTIARLANMQIDTYEVVSSFNLILSQRLIRKICPSCKVPDETITDEMKRLTPDFAAHAGATFHRGKGCRYCHQTGFSGRVGIFEVLELSPQIKQMVLTQQSPLVIRKAAIDEGMTPLRTAGWRKVEAGTTTFAEMNRVTFEEGVL